MKIGNVELTKVVKNGEVYIKRGDMNTFLGDYFKKKYPKKPREYMEISLGELWELTDAKVRKGNPNMPVQLYNLAYFKNLDRSMLNEKTWNKVQILLEQFFDEKPATDVNPDITTNTETAATVNLTEDTFLKGCAMIAAAINNNTEIMAEVTKLLAEKTVKVIDQKESVRQNNSVAEKTGNTESKNKVITPNYKVTNMPEYKVWKKNVLLQCREDVLIAQTLRLAYQRMNKNYGVVWEQERKDFIKEYGYKPDSTMEVAFFIENRNPAYENLLANCVYDVSHGGKDKTVALKDEEPIDVVVQGKVDPKPTVNPAEFVIKDLAEIPARMDLLGTMHNSTGPVLMSKFYSRVRSDQKLRYDRVCRQYRRNKRLESNDVVQVLDVLNSTEASRKRTKVLYVNFMKEYGIPLVR